jgi:chromosome segregation ATPase
MSTLSLEQAELPTAAVDDFSALEQRILRAVEVVKHERAARAEAEAALAVAQSEKGAQTTSLEQAQEQVHTLEREREQVRQRVERLLKQLDEITA